MSPDPSEPQQQRNPSEEAASSPAGFQLQEFLQALTAGHIDFVVLDSDQTLIWSKEVHLALMTRAAQEIGAPDLEHIAKTYSSLRGRAYTDIIAGIYEAAGGLDRGLTEAEFADKVYALADSIRTGETSLGVEPALIPGTTELLDAIQASGTPYMIATGSPRAITRMLQTQVGIAHYFDDDQLLCCGDIELNKKDPGYWLIVLNGRDPERVVGFEDHPHGTETMLALAGFGRVFVRPSVDPAQFEALASRYGKRVLLIGSEDSWAKIL